ncbi:MAG: proprotein convertase P-domain-containing protein [Lewinellaceae bacterium]|nr:proprotein convertase P-domain-containing protein [Lewinellaceae bacterium]
MLNLFTRRFSSQRGFSFLLAMFISLAAVHAQVFPISFTTIRTCSALFTDSGGLSGGYQGGESFTETICPANGTSAFTELVFNSWNLAPGDRLCFYDGQDTNAPLLLCSDQLAPGEPFIVRASATNASGCLTVTFTSNAAFAEGGWQAKIQCAPACQEFAVRIDTVLPSPGARGQIPLCPGDTIILRAKGDYPKNNSSYLQSDFLTNFRWNFGDGELAFGQEVIHIYREGGGYGIDLTATDQRGCVSRNTARLPVEVSVPPVFVPGISLPGTLCAADTIRLGADLGQSRNRALSILPGTGYFDLAQSLNDQTYLADGPNPPFTSTINYHAYSANQVITATSQIEALCLNIEHSSLRDLEITLQCPSGKQVSLTTAAAAKGTRVFLGEPIINDGNAQNPGVPYVYCWSPQATQPSWENFLAANSTLQTLPAGTYQSQDPWSNLLGCPFNGDWQITVTDRLANDNGYAFSWSLAFDSSLVAPPSYQTALQSQRWVSHPDIFFQTTDSVGIAPSHPGLFYVRHRVTDETGCAFETALPFTVLSPTDTACASCQFSISPLADTSICRGDSLQISLNNQLTLDSILTFRTNPRYAIGNANHPPTNPYAADLPVSGLPYSVIINPITQIDSVCLDLETDWDEDIALFLRAPNGQVLELSTNNGGGFDDYRHTCFTPSATLPITAGSPPFTGVFAPEGNWNVLANTPANGTWSLLVSDAFDQNALGRLNEWQLSFRTQNEVTYQWTPVAAVSCDTCLNPVFRPDTTTVFRLKATDTYGCVYTDSITISVLEPLPAPTVSCFASAPGTITFSWPPLSDTARYSLRLWRGGRDSLLTTPWLDTTYLVSGLNAGDSVHLQVSLFQDIPYPCAQGTGESGCVYGRCSLNMSVISQKDATCADSQDGNLQLRIENGAAPFQVRVNNGPVQQALTFSNLSPGDYLVTVVDLLGCTDTLPITIGAPLSLQSGLQVLQEIACNGDASGQLASTPSGGTAPYLFQWNNNQPGNPGLRDLPAGIYRLTLTDSRGCQRLDSISLRQPDALQVQATSQNPSCPNTRNGQITLTAVGGSGTYSFRWADGLLGASRNNLAPGSYCATVTDSNGCTTSLCETLVQPPPLQIDSVRLTPVSCFGRSNGRATIWVSGGTSPYRIAWNDSLRQSGPTANLLPAGAVNVTVTDTLGCILTATYTISSPPPIMLSLTATDNPCRGGAEGTIRVVVNGGTAPYRYAWENGQTDSIATGLEAGTYRVSITDANGCTANDRATVGEPFSFMVVETTQTTRGCFGQATNEASVQASGGTGPYQYQWSNGETTAIARGLDSIRYTVTVTDARGCSKESGILLRDLPDMDPNMIVNSPSCFGTSNGAIGINLIMGRPNANLNQYQFIWNTGQVGAAIQQLIGDQTYTVTITDPQGCTAVESRTVRSPKPITVAITTQPTRCFGSNDGEATISNITADTRNFTFQWDNRAGSATQESVRNLAAGTYTVTVTDENSCTGIGTALVGQPAALSLRFVSRDINCFGNADGRISVLPEGGTPPYRYLWNTGATTSDLINQQAGVYQVTVTDAQECSTTGSREIKQATAFTIAGQVDSVTCNGGRNGSITISPSGGRNPYEYSLDNRTFRGISRFIGLQAGNYTVYVRDGNGCLQAQRFLVPEPLPLVVDAGDPSYSIRLGDTLVLQASATNARGAVDFQWIAPYPGTLSCLNCVQTTVRSQNTITYRLEGTDSRGCQGEDRVQVVVEKERIVVVPTGFTPNSDQNNDRLLVHGQQDAKVLSFRVFDRWGELVFSDNNFSVNDETRGWDGFFRGQEAASGVYLWYLEVEFSDGFRDIRRGQTTLIR